MHSLLQAAAFFISKQVHCFLYVLSFINARPRKSTHPGSQVIAVIFAKGFILTPSSAFFQRLHFCLFVFLCVLESVVGGGQSVHLTTHSDASPGAIVHGTDLHLDKACLAQETEAA